MLPLLALAALSTGCTATEGAKDTSDTPSGDTDETVYLTGDVVSVLAPEADTDT
ncbi:MAG: hypothetical protein GY882_11510, partial [Actinomycetia bacterium]|nr:hypothetical protein [Actinomycetes bacterium]